ncbi:hypothetical protein F5141DRAFT_1221183 [Pisolithus sp. B1]|nr:hypothetical protein F5141DRAFT_1221183 [Pisolithus sp. B1]
MSSSQTLNITSRMIHLQVFYWFKQFAEGSILMDTALDSIEFTLGSNFDSNEWMDLTHCVMMEPDYWPAIEKVFMQELGHVGSSSAVPLLKDPSTWHLMMDWAQDKIGFSKLDDRMGAYGPRYIHKEWKPLIDMVFMLLDLGGETLQHPLDMLLIVIAYHLVGALQNKHHKVNSSIFVDIDAEDAEDQDQEGDKKVGPSGKGSYLQTINTLYKWFNHGVQEAMVFNGLLNIQLPTNIFPPPHNNIYIVEFYSGVLGEGTLIMVYKAQQVLPTQNWVQIKQSTYKGDIGYVKESAESDAVVLVAPHQLPYNLPKDSGERMRFDIELAKIADLDFMPILLPSGAKIRYSCSYVVTLHECTIVFIVMHPNKTSDHIEVSKFVVQSQLPEHILSLGPEDNESQLVPLLSGEEALPGDLIRAHCGPYVSQMGIIKWISPDGKVWVFKHGKGKGKEDVLADEENPAPSQTVVTMDSSNLCIKRAPNTLTLSKDKGYNVAVGDTVEVVRGQWHHSQCTVKAVDLTKASLDIVHPMDRVQINVPITFAHKIKEHFDHGLSKFISHDVWVIAGNKKGSWAMLHAIRRMSSWVVLFGQLIQLKNNQITTP